MRTIAALALAAALAAPAAAEEGLELDPLERFGFLRVMYDAKAPPTALALRLYRCNAASAEKSGNRPVLERIGRTFESEALEAWNMCAAEAERLAQDASAKEAAALKAAILRSIVRTIHNARNPPTVTCASSIPADMCWRPWRR